MDHLLHDISSEPHSTRQSKRNKIATAYHMESMPWERVPLEGGGRKYYVFPEEPQTSHPCGAYGDEWLDSGEEASDQEDQCVPGNGDDAHQWGRSSVAPLPSTTSLQWERSANYNSIHAQVYLLLPATSLICFLKKRILSSPS